uniref:Uncharacterized protein n=1 Tax=Ammopiptanthus mongolicus TaxID=126911 RepID=A0A4P8PG46_AMMMO|nr:hypothetical protein [Ammopiptanthus mongolicus]
MRHSDVTTGQLRAEPSNPHRFARPFCFDQFIPAPGHNVKRVIFNLSELFYYLPSSFTLSNLSYFIWRYCLSMNCRCRRQYESQYEEDSPTMLRIRRCPA